MPEQEDKSNFITVYRPIAGWKAIMLCWNDEDKDPSMHFWEPCCTGMCGYATKEEAVAEAKDWAAAEEVRFVP